jgi:TonB family protein
MRRIIVSTLFLSTVLAHAQPSKAGQGVTLEARNSTGVTFPKLLSAPSLTIAAADFPTVDLAAQHMLVSFRVDESGAPQNVHLVKSVSQSVDERVLAAVRQYRFAPGTLDNQTVPVDVNLVVNFAQK